MTTTTRTRPRGIGASDLADIMGCGFRGPLRFWGEVTGKIEPDNDPIEKPWLHWGHMHQPTILNEYNAREPGRFAKEFETTINHREEPLFFCTPDAVDLANGRLVEVKTSEVWNKAEWEDGLPYAYWLQVQHQYAVSLSRNDVLPVPAEPHIAALIGLSDYREYEIEPRPGELQDVWNEALEWWEKYVVKDIEPPADPSPQAIAALRQLHPEDTGAVVQLDQATHAKVLELAAWRNKLAEAKKQCEELRQAIEAKIGAATYGVAPDWTGVSLKWQERKEHTVKATRFRKLEILDRAKARKEGIS